MWEIAGPLRSPCNLKYFALPSLELSTRTGAIVRCQCSVKMAAEHTIKAQQRFNLTICPEQKIAIRASGFKISFKNEIPGLPAEKWSARGQRVHHLIGL